MIYKSWLSFPTLQLSERIFFSVCRGYEAPEVEAWVPHVILLTLHNLLPFIFLV